MVDIDKFRINPVSTTIKVNTLGGTGSGKTSIIEVLLDEWKGLTTSTIGIGIQDPILVNFTRRILIKSNYASSSDNFDAKFIVWDMGGQTKYRDLLQGYLPGSKGQIGVIDGVNPRSCESFLAQLFMASQILDESIPLLLLVNKADLFQNLSSSAGGQVWKFLSNILAKTIINSISLINFPLNSDKESLVNFWSIEDTLIYGREGLMNLIKRSIEVSTSSGIVKIDLEKTFGLENLKLLLRYAILLLLDTSEKLRIFEGKISEILPKIEWDRPGLIKPDNEVRTLTINAITLKILVSWYDDYKKTGNEELNPLPLTERIIQSCFAGIKQINDLKELFSSMTTEQIMKLATRYDLYLIEEQAEKVRKWIMNAKVYETTSMEPLFVKNIMIDFFKDVFIQFSKKSEEESFDLKDIAKQISSQRRRGRR